MRRVAIYSAVSGMVGLIVGMAVVSHEQSGSLRGNQAFAVQPAAERQLRVRGRAGEAELSITNEERTNVDVYENANPSVVNISTRSLEVNRFSMMQREAEGSGSGAVFDKDGHIITNFHVVEGANSIEVTMASNKAFPATLVGGDKEHDIAVLRVDARPQDL